MCCECEHETEEPRERFYGRLLKTVARKAVTWAKLGVLGVIGASVVGSILLVLDAALLGDSGRRHAR